MGATTSHTRFVQWYLDQTTASPAAVVLGREELDGNPADASRSWERILLFDVLGTLSAFELFLRVEQSAAEACEIIIGMPAKTHAVAAAGTQQDWQSQVLSMAQRFGFSQIDEREPLTATDEFEWLRLRRSTRPQFRLAKITAANAHLMRALFSRIFGHSMSEAFWRWKYADGRSQGMGLWQGEELIAHYGGVQEDIVLDGQQATAMQMVDVMVDPSVRHAARRQSPFFILTSAFVECFVGWQQPCLLAFGFPSHRHLRLAEHLKLYAPVGRMSEIAFASAKASWWSGVSQQWQMLTLNNFASFTQQLDALWQQMRAALPAATIVEKHAARIHRRYLTHPEIDYKVWLVIKRWSRKPLAAVVLKAQADSLLLMDIIGDPATFPAVIRQLQQRVQERENKPLVAWITHNCAAALAGPRDQIKDLPISIPTITWTAGPKPEQLLDRWWLTAGDTDFL
jgi:hypothetical protein